jgi:hypothetical protein
MRPFMRFGLIAVALVVLVGAAGGGVFFGFLHHFYFDPPKADYPKPKSPLEAQRQDLDYFRTLMAFDRSFSPDARKEAEERVDRLEQLPDALPPQKLHVALMQIMALADNGHTKMRSTTDDGKMMLEPVRITRFADGFFVMRARPEYRGLLGGRVESIDGMSFAQVLKELETLRGGKTAFRDENAALFIDDHDLLYGLGIARDPGQSVWTLKMPDGRTITRTLIAYSDKPGAMFDFGMRWRSPEPIKGAEKDWASYFPASGMLPQSERDFNNHFLYASIPGSCAAYVRVQDIVDTDGQKIQPFLKDTEAALRARPPCAVIFDLRGNGGGDYTNMWHFAHALPGLIAQGGHIYVLTDAMTFSAAITTTAFTKEAGGDKVTIIGEPIGDRLAFYAEGANGTLPNSKLSLSYETGKHDYGHPCWNVHDCFWLNWLYPVRVKTLEPDIEIPSRFSDWNEGHDLAFERAVVLSSSARGGADGSRAR